MSIISGNVNCQDKGECLIMLLLNFQELDLYSTPRYECCDGCIIGQLKYNLGNVFVINNYTPTTFHKSFLNY